MCFIRRSASLSFAPSPSECGSPAADFSAALIALYLPGLTTPPDAEAFLPSSAGHAPATIMLFLYL
jgi:hypothetical protein